MVVGGSMRGRYVAGFVLVVLVGCDSAEIDASDAAVDAATDAGMRDTSVADAGAGRDAARDAAPDAMMADAGDAAAPPCDVMSPFGVPENVAELNTASDEAPAWISADGCRLFLDRVTPGAGADIHTRGP